MKLTATFDASGTLHIAWDNATGTLPFPPCPDGLDLKMRLLPGKTGAGTWTHVAAVPPPPPPDGPPPGWSVIVSPLSIPASGLDVSVPFSTEGFRMLAFEVPANTIHAHPVRFDSSYYTHDGAWLTEGQFGFSQVGRDAVFSSSPGSMKPVNGDPYCVVPSGEAINWEISFVGKPQTAQLSKDVTIYLNVRAQIRDAAAGYTLRCGQA